MPDVPALQIAGVQLLEEVGRGARSVVYRARRGDRTVAVKFLLTADGDDVAAESLAFRRESATLATLAHPCLVRIHEVGEVDGLAYAIHEHLEGRSLAARLASGALPTGEAVAIAAQLAGVLGEVHRRRLIHRDLRPHNVVLVQEPRGLVKLVDFDLRASVRSAGAPGAYRAPEQTGMLDRPVDGRTDLYALGAVLFEMLAGRPPFLARDPDELRRQHAVLAPPRLADLVPQCPPALAAAVARLLAKDPDDRFQSAEELGAALGAIDPSLRAGLSGHDPKDRSELRLVGRGRELRRLEQLWRRASEGRGVCALVLGEPGSGKSQLLGELAAQVAGAPGSPPALSYRCVQEGRPLAVFRSALGDYVLRLRGLAEVPASVWAIVHELEALLGGSGEGGELQAALVDAAARLAAAGQGALMWVDDAEWIDEASLQALKLLANRLGELPLLLVVSGRADRWSVELGRGGAAEIVALDPLSEPEVGALVTALLGERRVDAELVRVVAARSGGVPLAIVEFVRAMLDGGVLLPHWDAWRFEAAGLESLRLPGDVLQLLVSRIHRLAPELREALRTAAVLGARFEPPALARVLGWELRAVDEAISAATVAHLVERGRHGDHGFVHDRVREALLSELPPEALRARHQRIAEALDDPAAEGDRLYLLAHHYLAGDLSAPARAYEVCLRAGQRAQAESADEDAYRYYGRADALRERAGLPPDVRLDDGLSEVCSRTGRHREADRYISRAMSQETDALRRAQLLRRQARVQLFKLEHDTALSTLGSAFQEIGARLPRDRAPAFVGSVVLWLLAALIRATGVGRVRDGARGRVLLMSQLFDDAVRVAYFDMRPLTLLQTVMRQRYYSERLGPAPALARAYASIGLVYASLGRRPAARRFAAEAVALAAAAGERRTLARVSFYAGTVHEFCGDVVLADQALSRVLADQHRWLESWGLVSAHQALAINLWARGHDARAQATVGRLLAALEVEGDRKTRQALVLTYALQGALHAGAGRGAEARRCLALARQSFAGCPYDRYQLANLLGIELIAALAEGELGEVVDDKLAAIDALGLDPQRVPFYLRFLWAWEVYARLCQAVAAPPDRRGPHLARLRPALRALAGLPEHPVLRGFLLLGRAALSWMTGLFDHALKDLSDAERLAFATDNRWLRCEVLRHQGHALVAAGRPEAGRREGRAAAAQAEELDWRGRAAAIEREFGLGPAGGDDGRGRPGDVQAAKLRRHLDALLELSLASATARTFEEQAWIAIDELARILAAERCALFLVQPGGALEFKVGRDARGAELPADFDVHRDVIEQVRAGREPVVVAGEGAQGRDRRSVLAAPLVLKERLIGVVYLDNRLVRGAFTGEDVEILQAIAGHIAIALETARTAQLEAQVVAAAQEKSALLEHATSAVGIGIAVLQPTGELAQHSPTLAAMTRRWPSVAAWWAVAARQLALPEPRPCPRCGEVQSLGRSVADLTEGGARQVFEITFTGHFHELTLAAPGHVLLVSDITARKISEENLLRLNEELTHARDAALAASRAKSTFLANMSHELRTPLNAIIGFSELLVEDAERFGARQMVNDLGKIRMSGAHLLDLISAILDLSKVETGKMQLEVLEFSVQALMSRVAATLTPMVAKNRNMLSQHVGAGAERMVGDETKVKQILFNLVSNAAKFTTDGVITLVAEAVEDGGRAWVEFTVRDTGIGFRADQIDNLFQDFYQADMSTTRKYGGTGLGLAIVHRFCKLMEGEVGVTSEPGIGSTFRVRLPRVLAPREPRLPGDEAPLA